MRKSLGVAGPEERIGEFIICAPLGLMPISGDCCCCCGDLSWFGFDMALPSFCSRFTSSGDDMAMLLLPVDVAVGSG